MESMRNIVLDFCRNSYQAITVKQYDKDSRILHISCTNYGEAFFVDKDIHECNVKMITPDNRAIFNPTTINDDGTITVVFKESMLYAGGKGRLELQLIDVSTQTTLSTMILEVIIVSSVYPDDVIIASDEFNVLTEALLSITEITIGAEEAINSIKLLEEDIQNEEAARVQAEIGREQAEVARVEAETVRDNEEISRLSNEETRIADENDRIANELARQNAETLRETNMATAIENAEEATNRANAAAEACENIVAGTGFIASTEKGAANGVATLDTDSKIPVEQLPDLVICSLTEPENQMVGGFWEQEY